VINGDGGRSHYIGGPRSHYIDNVPSGSVVVIAQKDNSNRAVMGGVISARAKTLGAAGIVVDGNVRDIEEHNEIDFPLFSRGSSVLCPYTRRIEIEIPIIVCGRTIVQGDYIVADRDGVVHIPNKYLQQVIELAPTIHKLEVLVRNSVLGGSTVLEAHKNYKS
jgi:regulator of RNase E activity RraA